MQGPKHLNLSAWMLGQLLHGSRTCEAWNLCAELVLLHKFFYTQLVKWLLSHSNSLGVLNIVVPLQCYPGNFE